MLNIVTKYERYGTGSYTLPGLQAGDVVFMFGFNADNTNTPALAANMTSIVHGVRTRISYGVATTTSFSCSFGTGNVYSHVIAVRGLDSTSASTLYGASAVQATATTYKFDALTLSYTDGRSRVMGFAGNTTGRVGDKNVTNMPYVHVNSSYHHNVSTDRMYGNFVGGESSGHSTLGTVGTGTLEIFGDIPAPAGFEHLDQSGAGLVNAASGSGHFLENSGAGYIRKAGTEGAGSLILDANGRIITKA